MHKNEPRRNRLRSARTNPLADCPLTAAFAAIGGKWKLTLLYWLAHGESHFAGLRRRAAPISAKVLAEQLRELEADGLIERDETGPVPNPVIYRLSGYGQALAPLVEQMRLWGEAHLRMTRADGDSATDCAEPLRRPPD